MFVLKGLLYAGSSAALLALCTYIVLALRGDSPTLLSTHAGRMTFKAKLFLGLASIGFLVCLFQGAEALLFWLPDTWGALDEDGGFRTLRSSFAAMFATVGGMALIYFLNRATIDMTSLRVLREQIENERMIYSSESLQGLDSLKSTFQGKIKELESMAPCESLLEESLRIEYLQIRAYRQLLSLLETRIDAIHDVQERTLEPAIRQETPRTGQEMD